MTGECLERQNNKTVTATRKVMNETSASSTYQYTSGMYIII